MHAGKAKGEQQQSATNSDTCVRSPTVVRSAHCESEVVQCLDLNVTTFSRHDIVFFSGAPGALILSGCISEPSKRRHSNRTEKLH